MKKKEETKMNDNVTSVNSSETTEISEVPAVTDKLRDEVVTKPELQEDGPRSIAYFTSWSAYDRTISVKDIDPTLLTHVNFAFANLTSEGEIIVEMKKRTLDGFRNRAWRKC